MKGILIQNDSMNDVIHFAIQKLIENIDIICALCSGFCYTFFLLSIVSTGSSQ